MADNIFTGAVNGNWNNAGNWSQAAVPTASDGHTCKFFNVVTSPNCTVDGANRVCNAIDFTGYTNTLTMTFKITVSGPITLASGMTIAGAGALEANTTATHTSNGKTWPNALTLSGISQTHTLGDNWDVDGLVTVTGNGASSAVTVNGNTLTCGEGLTHLATSGTASGTTSFVLNGTGTVTGSSSGGSFQFPLTINTAGTITFANGGTFTYIGTLTYTAGTVITTGHTLTINGSSTLTTNGITWNNVTVAQNSTTLTLSDNLNVAGLFSAGAPTSGTITLNGNTINVAAGLRQTQTTGTINGTSIVKLTGTGTVDAPSINGGKIDNQITLAANTGTITIATAGDTAFPIRLNLLKYDSGTIITDAGTWASSGGGSSTHGFGFVG